MEGGPGELLACQSGLSAGDVNGAITLSAITWHVQDKQQSGQSAWGKEWQVLLDLPGLLL